MAKELQLCLAHDAFVRVHNKSVGLQPVEQDGQMLGILIHRGGGSQEVIHVDIHEQLVL